MMFSSALTVFMLGLRHGADPDHLAAIDNMTRNSIARAPRLSRFIGTIFAGGHTVTMLGIAALVGYLGTRFAMHGALVEAVGTWISIVVLLGIAGLNLRQLRSSPNVRLVGVKNAMLPRALRNATSPWVAVPIGLLFGFGFETSSQVATYAIAFGADAGVLGALVVGSMFCFGMICTDTLDSVFIHRAVSYQGTNLPSVTRAWIWAVTIFALAVAAFELAQVLGWKPPVSDLSVSVTLVSALCCVFAWALVATKRKADDR